MTEAYELKELKGLLHTKWAGRQLFFYEKTDSTNLQAKLLAEKNLPHGTLVVADAQTAGKGRCGRNWESPKGTNLYFTIILRPDFEPAKASMLTLVTAYGVAEGIRKELERENIKPAENQLPLIKWPNDILMGDRKICGILTELYINSPKPENWYVLVGVGINVKHQSFSEALSQKATSIGQATGVSLSRSRLLGDIIEVFEESYERFVKKGDLSFFQEDYNRMLVNRNKEVYVLDPKGQYSGIAKGITPTGELLVELGDGTVTEVYAGEVSVRGIYGYV